MISLYLHWGKGYKYTHHTWINKLIKNETMAKIKGKLSMQYLYFLVSNTGKTKMKCNKYILNNRNFKVLLLTYYLINCNF